MAEGIGKNFTAILIALKNVIARLIHQFPLLVFIVIGLMWVAFYYFSSSPTKMTFALSFLVSLISVVIYANTKKYGDTVLTFMLGLLTIFSTEWTTYTSILFFSFYLGFHAIIFIISSVTLAAKVESELTMAANFLDYKNHSLTLNKLQKIKNIDTKFNALSGIERAKSIKFLSFMKMPLDEISQAIGDIESIKIVYQTDLTKSLEFYRALYYLKNRSSFKVNVTNFLDLIISKKIPVTPEEFFKIFSTTKGIIIQEKVQLEEYLEQLEQLVYKGLDTEQIIKELLEK